MPARSFLVVVCLAAALSATAGAAGGAGRRAHRAAPPAEVILAALAHARAHSFRRDAVDWTAIELEIRALAAQARSDADTQAAIRHLFSRIGDRHSVRISWTAKSELHRQAKLSRPPTARAIEQGRHGLVEITYFLRTERKESHFYQRRAWSAIERVDRAGPCGWVVDLRANQGGNPRVMLAALQPFLGATTVADEATPSGKRWIQRSRGSRACAR